jgi:hypothetical protein
MLNSFRKTTAAECGDWWFFVFLPLEDDLPDDVVLLELLMSMLELLLELLLLLLLLSCLIFSDATKVKVSIHGWPYATGFDYMLQITSHFSSLLACLFRVVAGGDGGGIVIMVHIFLVLLVHGDGQLPAATSTNQAVGRTTGIDIS